MARRSDRQFGSAADAQRRYELLLEHSPNIILHLAPDGMIRFINRAEPHDRAEVEGCDASRYFARESLAALREMLRQVFAHGGSTDGELRTLTGNVLSCRAVLLDPDRCLVIATDMTQYRQTEDGLRERERLLSAIVENLPHMVFVKEAENLRFVRFNKAAEDLLGYRQEDLLGKSDFDFFPRAEAEFFTAKDREVLRSRGVLDIPEESIETRAGKRVLHTKKVPILGERGEPRYLLGISEDITEQKRAEEERRSLETQVQRAQKLESLGLLAGGIAHDFNNLLSGILMSADLARRDVSSGSHVAEMLDDVLTSTQRAAALTRQMLAYAGKGSFAVERLDLNAVIDETRTLIHSSISKKATLRLDRADRLPTVMADPTQMQQIVMNLVINASEALGDAIGTIAIATESRFCSRETLRQFQLATELSEGSYVMLSVRDSGCGMDEATRTRVFDPFFSTKFAGRGLGLAAILGIVRGHHGGIRVDSAPGQGTTFTLIFPTLADAAVSKPASPARDDAWQGEGTVLLVDDEDIVRVATSGALEALGFAVLTARDGREALEQFREHHQRVACVLLDFKMPYMDGGEVFPLLQRIDESVPVILSSGYSEQESAEQLVDAGIAGFLRKPYTLNDLRRAMKAALTR